MLDDVRRYIRREGLLRPQEPVWVAVSGGLDSMALLHVLRALGHPCSVAHVDHGLRGRESDDDAAFVEEHCMTLGVPFRKQKVDVAARMAEFGGSVQMAARELRHDWFRLLNHECSMSVALAHHTDDAVETLFINLLRGTGVHGWAGITPRSDAFVRPLLGVHRHVIEAYAQVHAIPFREDSSNADPKYLRNRIRRELLPLLEELRPGARNTVARSIDLFRELEVAGKKLCDDALVGLGSGADGSFTIPFGRIEGSPVPGLVLHEVLRARGFHPNAIERIHDAIGERATGAFFTAGPWRAFVDREALVLGPVPDELPVFVVDPDARGEAGPFRWSLEEGPSAKVQGTMEEVLLDADQLSFPMEIRPWRSGDRIRPIGLGGSKLVSDILTDAKVPAARKREAYVLMSGGEVVWLVGHRIAEGFQATSTTRRALDIAWRG